MSAVSHARYHSPVFGSSNRPVSLDRESGQRASSFARRSCSRAASTCSLARSPRDPGRAGGGVVMAGVHATSRTTASEVRMSRLSSKSRARQAVRRPLRMAGLPTRCEPHRISNNAMTDCNMGRRRSTTKPIASVAPTTSSIMPNRNRDPARMTRSAATRVPSPAIREPGSSGSSCAAAIHGARPARFGPSFAGYGAP